jgi:Flp pilus assembly protein TadB
MNPAIIAANTAVTVAVAAAAAQRQKLRERLEQLPPQQATRERVLEGQGDLASVLDHMIEQRMVRVRPDGTLRFDPDARQAAAHANGKVALLVLCVLGLVFAAVAVTLLALAP